jgi:hypothetical protein
MPSPASASGPRGTSSGTSPIGRSTRRVPPTSAETFRPGLRRPGKVPRPRHGRRSVVVHDRAPSVRTLRPERASRGVASSRDPGDPPRPERPRADRGAHRFERVGRAVATVLSRCRGAAGGAHASRRRWTALRRGRPAHGVYGATVEARVTRGLHRLGAVLKAFEGLVITEINPDRDGDGTLIHRLVGIWLPDWCKPSERESTPPRDMVTSSAGLNAGRDTCGSSLLSELDLGSLWTETGVCTLTRVRRELRRRVSPGRPNGVRAHLSTLRGCPLADSWAEEEVWADDLRT